jgi:hypothetical protein
VSELRIALAAGMHLLLEPAPRDVSEVDPVPLRLVADGFLPGRRRVVEAFEDRP